MDLCELHGVFGLFCLKILLSIFTSSSYK
jgi:hypothetical protein